MKLKLLIISVILSCSFAYVSSLTIKEPCDYFDTVNITGGEIEDNGNIIFNGTKFPKEMYAQYNYVIENYTQIKLVNQHTRGCICLIKPCIRLCCYSDEVNTTAPEGNIQCASKDSFSVEVDFVLKEIHPNSESFKVLLGKPCPRMYKTEPKSYDDDVWQLHENGSVEISGSYKNHEEYCLGGLNSETLELYLCFSDKHENNIFKFLMISIGMLISIPFLILTFLVYSLIPELRNVLGKSLMCYVVGLSVSNIILLINQLNIINNFELMPCKFVGYVGYISIMTCFFWLNVMSYDTWSSLRGRSNGSGRNNDKETFRNYCIYGFGVPVSMTMLLVWIDNSSWISPSLHPQFGYARCWIIYNSTVEFLYVYMPISVIMCVNITFYSLTAYWLYKVQRDVRKVKNGENQNHSNIKADKNRFSLYLRLFIIMGVTWSMEPISWFFNDSHIIFYITDLLNCLQGFIIFILFVCKRNVLNLLMKRFGCFKNSTTSQTVEYKASNTSENEGNIQL